MITKERWQALLHLWLYEDEADCPAWRDGLTEDEEALVGFWDLMDRRLFSKEDEAEIRRFWDLILPEDGILDPMERELPHMTEQGLW